MAKVFFSKIFLAKIFSSPQSACTPQFPGRTVVTLYLESASAEDVEVQRWQEDQSWRLEAEANIEH